MCVASNAYFNTETTSNRVALKNILKSLFFCCIQRHRWEKEFDMFLEEISVMNVDWNKLA